MSEKWFGNIHTGEKYNTQHSAGAKANKRPSRLEVKAKVPLDALYKCWHIYPRLDKRYYTADLITDLLSGGGSSRLYQSLVKEKQLFSNINCFHFGSVDAGLLSY
ncbi:MAG: insulinase family protein [Chitinophagaceae bacterium]